MGRMLKIVIQSIVQLFIILAISVIEMSGRTRRVHVSLTNEQRLSIYEKKYHPDGRVKSGSPSLEQLGQWAAQQFSLNRVPDKGTISKMLKRIHEEGPGSTSRSDKRKRVAKGRWPVSVHVMEYSFFSDN